MTFKETALSKATIRIQELLSNIEAFKEILTEQTKFMAVIKANAYSHGAVRLAGEMETAYAVDYFGVAQLSEALELRAHGIQTPILIFNSIRENEVEQVIKEKLTMTVFSVEVAEAIVRTAEKLQLEAHVHLKIDSGMARLGVVDFDEAMAVYEALESDYVSVEGIYTHFADAKENTPDNFTHEQFTRFKQILHAFDERGIAFTLRHCCNTAGTINFPDYHLDMVRVGLGLYGQNPTADNQDALNLTPIQTVQTTVTHVKYFPAGESVGYGRTYVSKEPMRIATVAIGYADGVAKSLSNKGFFTYRGHRLPILGEVCMDQLMLDCSNIPNLGVGDRVTYFGDPKDGDLRISEVAEMAHASQYDLLCRIGDRVERVYE